MVIFTRLRCRRASFSNLEGDCDRCPVGTGPLGFRRGETPRQGKGCLLPPDQILPAEKKRSAGKCITRKRGVETRTVRNRCRSRPCGRRCRPVRTSPFRGQASLPTRSPPCAHSACRRLRETMGTDPCESSVER